MKRLNYFTCFLFGHIKSKFTDSGYNICKRCDSHEYYDNWNVGYLRSFHWIQWKYNIIISKLKFSFKNELPF